MLLLAHIFMGTGALLLGPVAMLARKARGFHSRVGEIYHALVLGVCVTAAASRLRVMSLPSVDKAVLTSR